MRSEYFMNKDKFILQSVKKHGNKYDYSLVEYKSYNIPVKIICNIHGVFEQKPTDHKDKGRGCHECGKDKHRKNTECFIIESKKLHGNNKYDYSLVDYKTASTKVEIICLKHGKFEQRSGSHLRGNGCPKCGEDKMTINRKTTYDFIKEAILIHGEKKYDYSTIYFKNSKKVKIICSLHGSFDQTPSNHLKGKGCPCCNESKGEKKISSILDSYNIKYKRQFRFKDCRNIYPLPFDFYIEDKNICIEYDGRQHYEVVSYMKKLDYESLIKNDKIKNKYCFDKNIYLLRIRYDENIENKILSIIND